MSKIKQNEKIKQLESDKKLAEDAKIELLKKLKKEEEEQNKKIEAKKKIMDKLQKLEEKFLLGEKLTCRKIFKKKYTIFLILSLIVNIFLVSLYTIKSNKIKGITIEMKELDEQKSQIDNSINLLKKQNNEDVINISNLQNEIESIKIDIEEKTKKEEDTRKAYKPRKK